MSFAAQIKAWEEKTKLAMNKSVCNAVERLFTNVVVLSPSPSHPGPYAKGVLSNQYYPMIGGNYSTALTIASNPNGTDSLSRIKAMLASSPFLGKDNKITLTNNCDYAYRAENLGWPVSDGWSGKIGAYKMVATSINNLKAFYI